LKIASTGLSLALISDMSKGNRWQTLVRLLSFHPDFEESLQDQTLSIACNLLFQDYSIGVIFLSIILYIFAIRMQIYNGAPIHENYDPHTGKRLKASHFSWSAAHLLLLYEEYK